MAYSTLNHALYNANYNASIDDYAEAAAYRHWVRQAHSLVTLVIIGPEIGTRAGNDMPLATNTAPVTSSFGHPVYLAPMRRGSGSAGCSQRLGLRHVAQQKSDFASPGHSLGFEPRNPRPLIVPTSRLI